MSTNAMKGAFAELKEAKKRDCLSATDCVLLKELRRKTKTLLGVMDLVVDLYTATATAHREIVGTEVEVGQKIPPAVKARALEIFSASRSKAGKA